MKGSEWWASEVPEELGDGYTRAVLKAIADGHAYQTWHTIQHGDLTFEICNPLAIGTFEDHVFLFGLSAEAVDLIALELGDVMSPTPLLWDAAAEDDRQVPIGPHTQPNGKVGMMKSAAKRHSDLISGRQGESLVEPCSLISACCKTYVLDRYRPPPGPAVRAHYACEYGWRLSGPVSWGSPNDSKTGYVVQGSHWAHFYRQFWDYSMGAVYVKTAALLHGKPVDLRDVATDAATAGVVSLSGTVPFIIHPDCSKPGEGLSEPPDTEPAPGSPQALPTLRLGDRGGAVETWQAALIAAGFSLAPYGADGHFGRLTHDMTRRYQRSRGLLADGLVGPKTWSTVGDGVPLLPEPSLSDPLIVAPEPPFPPIRGTAARQAVFGKFAYVSAPHPKNPEAIRITDDWVRDNITKINVPQLRGVYGAPSDGGIYFHRLAIDQLLGLFDAWEQDGLMDRVLSWAGSWVPRFIRGSRSVLSNHAFGSAFDINAPWNPLGATPADVGEKGSVIELVPRAHEFGFYWGGHFGSRPDGMHFEIGKVM